MTDNCPILTSKDLELIGSFRNEIASIQSSENAFFENLSKCDIQSGGGLRDNIISIISKVIVFSITAMAAGASAAFFLTVIPESYQMYILTIVNRSPSFNVCMTPYDYASGLAQGLLNHTMSCSYRAEMFEQGITRIQMAVGAATGISTILLEDKIKQYLTGNANKMITNETNGGKRFNKKQKKTRKTRKTRKHKKSRRF